jgi:hypothetical protein
MITALVASMKEEARSFYDREFDFFNEVTSISGKLKPYIKKSKPEKKVFYIPECCSTGYPCITASGQDR